jgi:hypothetical protein
MGSLINEFKTEHTSLIQKTWEHVTSMGETGAGITSQDQINMDIDSKLTNKWSG